MWWFQENITAIVENNKIASRHSNLLWIYKILNTGLASKYFNPSLFSQK
ncbi:hypothetical protein PEDI_36140 [Persicobacter diffluens]|uniref:Uncharacterized protein n=1 Tax=Persicobacter diffluens TaxID=981 RepID=A0AAN4W2F5_9BACT|nr:hypothetical protein PEDI_36140 [Persicobacter diffluens]